MKASPKGIHQREGRPQRVWDHGSREAEEAARRNRLARAKRVFERNSEEPAIVAFRAAERALQQHTSRLQSQLETVVDKVDDAEREVASISAAHALTRTTIEDTTSAAELSIGPPLREITSDDRIEEVMRVLLRGTPHFVDDAKIVSHVAMFGNPIETIETVCGVTCKLTAELYSALTDILPCAIGERAAKLQPHVEHVRAILASALTFSGTVRDQCFVLRNKCEDLEALLESTTIAKTAACRIGKELAKENESLRQELFKTAVRARNDRTAEILEGDVSKSASHRFMVMLQCENTHTLRLSKPRLMSEALLLVQSVVEGAMAECEGKRANYNSTTEAREMFDRERNIAFAPESYFLDFASIGHAAEFCSKLQLGLAEKVNWPGALLALDEFAQVMDPEDAEQVLWRGVRVRAAMHVGTPNITHPLASTTAADNAPYYAGVAMERVASLLQRSRGGETLLSGAATESFMKFRFDNPLACPGIELFERQLGLVPGIGPNEKIRTLLPARLQRRLRPEEALHFRAPYQCVYPPLSFWKNVVQAEDLTAAAFADDDDYDGAARRLTPFEYEDIIAKQQKEAETLRARLEKSQDAFQAALAELQDARAQLEQSIAETDRQQRRAERAERRFALFAELSAKLERQLHEVHGELSWLHPAHEDATESLEALRAHVEAERSRRALITHAHAAVGPDPSSSDDDGDSDDVAGGTRLAQRSRSALGRSNSVRASVSGFHNGGGNDGSGCSSCPAYIALLDSVHNVAKLVGRTMTAAVETGELSAPEATRGFLAAARRVVAAGGSQPTPEIADLVDAAVDTPGAAQVAPSICGHLARVLQAAIGFGIMKRVRSRHSVSGGSGGGLVANEVDALAQQNESLAARVADLDALRRAETAELRDTIRSLNNELDGRMASDDVRVQELELRVKALTLKLHETSNKAQKYFSDANRLVDELQTTQVSAAQNAYFKEEFLRLNAVHEIGGDDQEVKRVMHEQSRHLRALTVELEARIRAKEEELEAREAEFRRILAARMDETRQNEASLEAQLQESGAAAVENATTALRREHREALNEAHRREQLRDVAKRRNIEEAVRRKMAGQLEATVEQEVLRRMGSARSAGSGTSAAVDGRCGAVDGGGFACPESSEQRGAAATEGVGRAGMERPRSGDAVHEPLSAMIAAASFGPFSAGGAAPPASAAAAGATGHRATGGVLGEDGAAPSAFHTPLAVDAAAQTVPAFTSCSKCGASVGINGAANDPDEASAGAASPLLLEAISELHSLRPAGAATGAAGGSRKPSAAAGRSGSGVDLEALVAMTETSEGDALGSMTSWRSLRDLRRSNASSSKSVAAAAAAAANTEEEKATKVSRTKGAGRGQGGDRGLGAVTTPRHTAMRRTPSGVLVFVEPGALDPPAVPSPRMASPPIAAPAEHHDGEGACGGEGRRARWSRASLAGCPAALLCDAATMTSGSSHLAAMQRLRQNSTLEDAGRGRKHGRGRGRGRGHNERVWWGDNRDDSHNDDHDDDDDAAEAIGAWSFEDAAAPRASGAGLWGGRQGATRIHPALSLVQQQQRPKTASISAGGSGGAGGLMMTGGVMQRGRQGAVALRQRLHEYSDDARSGSPGVTLRPVSPLAPDDTSGIAALLGDDSGATMVLTGVDDDDAGSYPSAAHASRITDTHNRRVRQSATHVRVRHPSPKLHVRARSPAKQHPTAPAIS